MGSEVERMLHDAPVYPALQVQRPVPKLQTPRPEQYSYSIISSVAVLPSVMAQATSVPVTDEMSHVNDVKAGLPVWLCRLFSIGYSGQEVKVTVYGAPPFAVVPLVHVAASTLSRFVKAVVHAAPLYVRGAMACRQTCLSTISVRVRALCLNTMEGNFPLLKTTRQRWQSLP